MGPQAASVVAADPWPTLALLSPPHRRPKVGSAGRDNQCHHLHFSLCSLMRKDDFRYNNIFTPFIKVSFLFQFKTHKYITGFTAAPSRRVLPHLQVGQNPTNNVKGLQWEKNPTVFMYLYVHYKQNPSLFIIILIMIRITHCKSTAWHTLQFNNPDLLPILLRWIVGCSVTCSTGLSYILDQHHTVITNGDSLTTCSHWLAVVF